MVLELGLSSDGSSRTTARARAANATIAKAKRRLILPYLVPGYAVWPRSSRSFW